MTIEAALKFLRIVIGIKTRKWKRVPQVRSERDEAFNLSHIFCLFNRIL